MDKKVYAAVMERADGYCEICGEWMEEKLQLHHIIGGNGKRQNYETVESCIALCDKCHRAAHDFKIVRILLKQLVQWKYRSQGFNDDEIWEKMGGRMF